MCDTKGETIWYCDRIWEVGIKRVQGKTCCKNSRKLCGKHNLKRSEEWYEHDPGVVENEFCWMLWSNVTDRLRQEIV